MQLEFSATERERETERVRRDLAALAQSAEHGPRLLAEANSLLDEIRDRGTCSDEQYLELAEQIVAALAPIATDPGPAR
jgi:DNA-binding IclR family transcriptional regulator